MEENKWGLAPFILGQKQRVFEPYSLSLSSMVAATISQKLCPEHSNQLSRKWRYFRKKKRNGNDFGKTLIIVSSSVVEHET